ncbi:amino acid adenylation domain-containing protein [Crossiella sp. CA-258035]|uniref:non-ribosomal peptide synthetase n=1 Tax=Crossiella sp. CA-258035 TaxID=2981138 RepID=UPI0024BC5C67|nr:non-ribosomal peptide synthetase [Crossiella sp. CA-258035]WHT22386.1 amino acid adenylation domain-containing protein [Crossiella sp. CA-258035]
MSTSSISRAELLQRRLRGLSPAAPEHGITPVPRDGALPLSFAQRRLWVLDQIQPGGTEYLMPLRLRLRGLVNVVALRAALEQVVARHEILRTRYSTVDGEPVQIIDPPGPITWREADLRGANSEARIGKLIDADGRRPIDLATEHPIRALLIRLTADETILLITTHHIAADGWSESVLLTELDRLYATLAAGMPSPLPPVPVQYADYAAWQREQLTGAHLADQLAHWRKTLAGLTPLALPTDRPRGPVRDSRGATETFTLPARLVEPLLRTGREVGATPFMVLLAAFQLLLGRYAGAHDVVVGSPVAGRDRAELQHLVGLFVNTVVLRTDLSGDPTFRDLVARVRETALAAYAHQHTPFERIVDELAPERDPSRNPLFQVTFQLTSGTPTELTGLRAEQEPVAWSAAKFDLGLALAAHPDGSLTGQLEYATALFDASTIRRLIGHFTQLLTSIAARPAVRVSALDLLTAPERAQLLGPWAGAARTFPAAECLHEVFQAQVRRDPEATALRHHGRHLTYARLNARANRLAHALRARGAGPDHLVGVCLDRGPELVVALLAVLKSGAGYLPLDPAAPADRLAYLLEDAEVSLAVTDTALPGVTCLPVDQPGHPDTDPENLAAPDNLAYVIYTSGSTGRPKGVQVSHANVVRLLRACEPDFGFGPTDVWTLFHSYAFDFSVWELWGALLHGGTAVVVPYEVSRSPQDFLDLLVREQVTVLNQTPSAFRGLVEAVTQAGLPADALALRTVVFGGEALDVTELAPWFDRFGDQRPELVNMYGITETTVHVTYRPIGRADLDGELRSPVGGALRDLRLYVLDEELNPVPIGVPGQVHVSGPGLARGYLGKPALTADRFGPDPYATTPGARMYRTGDLARYRADGDLEFLGRADNQVKIRGHRIEPGEIEAALSTHPSVDKALVLAHRSRLVAYLTGRPAAVTELREHLGRTLPAYMVPALFVPVADFPLTVNGKIDHAALPDPDTHRGQDSAERVAPRNPVEQVIAETWAEVLGVPEVGVRDNFFTLGGDSIRAIRVIGALRPRGIDLSVQNLLLHQTVEELARFNETRVQSTVDNAEEQRVDAFALLSPADRSALPAGLVDAYPMSMVQAAMVYQMIADSEESPYHNITLLPINDDGPFDLTALRQAAALLARRHEILRTSFALNGFSEPLQLVHPAGTIEVGYHDLRDTADPDAEIQRFITATRATPFDVTKAPMLRFHAHQTAEDRWTFSFIECHAILDGWSHHSLITELMADYRALREGREPAESTVHSVRFADYIALERRSLTESGDREFWRDRLSRFDRVELPEGWAADPAQGETAYKIGVPIGDLEPGLRALAVVAGVSLKSVLFTAHLKALSVLSGSQRFHTGLVCNGRLETSGGETVRGMHLNTVPVGVELTGSTWIDLVRQVFAEEVAVWPHRRFPLPEMQREWGGGASLVETAFTYLDFHVLDARRIESAGVVDVSPNEFALDVWTFPGALFLAARPERISRANGERLAKLYRRILELMAADPLGAARNNGLDEQEAARLLSFANGEPVQYPELCLHELFEQQVSRTPDAVALHCPDGSTVDYAELNARANRIARHLRDLGVGQESRVGILLRRGPDLVAAMLGVLKAGAAYLPLDPAHPAQRLAGLLAETRAEVVLAESATASLLSGDNTVLLDRADLTSLSTVDLTRTATPDSLAYIIYTSGSTGTPKGVMIEHRNLVNYVLWCLDAYTPLRGNGSPLYSSVAFDLPVTSVFPALLTGQPVTITADDGTPGIDALVDALENGEFGLLKLTPSHLAVLNQSLSPEAIRRATGRIIAGGEELVRDMVSSWAQHAPDTVVDNEYGPTETTVGCSWLEATPDRLEPGVLPIGKPIANTVMWVLDANLELVPVGVAGELYIGGAQLARGYVERPELTAARFIPDPFASQAGARLYRTGDLARYRPDGVLEFAGRVDHQVKIRGYRIELGEIEAALHRQVPLQDVTVRVHTAPSGDKELIAYLVPAEGTTLDLAALPGSLAELLPDYLVPQAFLELDELPLTANGKVDTARLPQPELSRTAARFQAPRTAVENILARAWAEALRLPRIGVHDSFTELGGHSLSVMRIIVKLREEHGIRLSFRDFYEHRTIAELARIIGTAAESDVDSLDAVVWLRRGGSKPPLFCVHPGSAHWFTQLAEHLGPDQPVAAFEWPGLSRQCPAPESVRQIAELNLAQLRRLQPTGPYRLLGWCGGSQITTEMTRQLRAEGEQVTFMLLDPALDSHDRANMHEFMARFRRAEALLAELATAVAEEVPGIQDRAVGVLEQIVDDGRIDPPVPGDEFWPSRVRVWRELLATRLDYRHEPCPGRLHLIAGDELAAGEHEVAVGVDFTDYTQRWAELATGGLDVHRVSGNHLGVLRPPHVGEVARVLTRLMATPEDVQKDVN